MTSYHKTWKPKKKKIFSTSDVCASSKNSLTFSLYFFSLSFFSVSLSISLWSPVYIYNSLYFFSFFLPFFIYLFSDFFQVSVCLSFLFIFHSASDLLFIFTTLSISFAISDSLFTHFSHLFSFYVCLFLSLSNGMFSSRMSWACFTLSLSFDKMGLFYFFFCLFYFLLWTAPMLWRDGALMPKIKWILMPNYNM